MPLITTFIRSASQKTRQQVRKLRYNKSDNVQPLLLSQSTSSVADGDGDGDFTTTNYLAYNNTALFIVDAGDIDSSDHSSVDKSDADTDDDVSILLLAPPSNRTLFDSYPEEEDKEGVDDGDNGTEDDDKVLFASMMESESSLSKFLRTKILPGTRRPRRASMTSCSRSSSSKKASPTSSITEIEISETTEDLSDSLSLGEDEIWWSLKDSDTITTTRGSSLIDVSSRSDTTKSSLKNNRKKKEEKKKKKQSSEDSNNNNNSYERMIAELEQEKAAKAKMNSEILQLRMNHRRRHDPPKK
mmetsp:Transcript_35824/g.39940  ORF Transcript_35824/g.39940 Transcript_35824/m.39940 type:complete len:300 (-) Transcript_35824:21-920(-)